MNRFAWLVRRELWEHRAIWMAPAIVIAILLLGAVTGNLFIGDITVDADTAGAETGHTLSKEDVEKLKKEADDWTVGASDEERQAIIDKLEKMEGRRVVGPAEALGLVPKAKQLKIVGLFYAAVAMLVVFVMGTIAFFYSLDALYSDRRDRSVLFWKSLPLSDAETVLAKFFTAAVGIPVVAAVAALLAQLIAAAGASAKVAIIGGDPSVLWNPAVLATALGSVGLMAAVSVLWYAPLVAYLLLVSAWSPRSPFLWASLPPVAVVMLERIAFGTAYVQTFLVHRFLGPFKAMVNDTSATPGVVVRQHSGELDITTTAADLGGRILDFVISPSMLVGLLGAAALIALAIWGRRYREENT
jgi:ABC-2 type transport system permease protein